MSEVAEPEAKGLGWVVGQVVLMTGCGVAGWRTPGDWSISGFDWLLSLILAVASAVFGIAGVWVLGRNRTIYPEPRERSQLIRHGIYRYVRHPLYSSVMLLAFAWGVYRHSAAALLLASVLAAFLAFKAKDEERRLLRRFPDYAEYQRATRRFLPGLV